MSHSDASIDSMLTNSSSNNQSSENQSTEASSSLSDNGTIHLLTADVEPQRLLSSGD